MIPLATYVSAFIALGSFLVVSFIVVFLKTVQQYEMLVVFTSRGTVAKGPGLRIVPPWRKYLLEDLRWGSFLMEKDGVKWVVVARCKDATSLALTKKPLSDSIENGFEDVIGRYPSGFLRRKV